MPTFSQYVRDVLGQAMFSYEALRRLEDGPGDLTALKKEWTRIVILFRSLAERIEDSGQIGDVYSDLAKRCRHYTENYDFGREIDTISGLYADDPHRIKNMRLKVLESFDDNKIIDGIASTMGKLDAV